MLDKVEDKDNWAATMKRGLLSPIHKGTDTVLSRLGKRKYFSTTPKSKSTLALPPRTNVFVSLAVYEVSKLDAVESTFFAKVRPHIYMPYPTSAVPKNLLKKTIEEGGMSILTPAEFETLKEELPEVEFYNEVDKTCLNPPAYRLYHNPEASPSTALMVNAL